MQDKLGCLNCHFLCATSITREGRETYPLPYEYRNKNDFSKMMQKLDIRVNIVKCFHGYWNAERMDTKNTTEIESIVFRKDRGSKCLLFSAYDKDATLEAVIERNKRKEEVIDRKTTRCMAWAAITVSAIATLLVAILPHYLSGR